MDSATSPRRKCKRSVSCTETFLNEFQIHWSVKYSALLSQRKGMIQSDVFTRKSQWRLQMYPEGDGNDNFNYVSLFLALVKSDVDHIKARFQFSIYNNGTKTKDIFSPKVDTFLQGERYGYSRLMKTDLLIPQSDSTTFTISCVVNAENSLLSMGARLEERSYNLSTSDVVLRVDGIEFYAHKAILSAHSPVFCAMFMHDMKENNENCVKIYDLDTETAEEMLRYIYAGEVNNLDKLAPDLLKAADKYFITGLKVLCEQELCCHLRYGRNAIRMLLLADMNNAGKLKEEAIRFIASNHSKLVNSPEAKIVANLRPDLLNNILTALSEKFSKCRLACSCKNNSRSKRRRTN